MSARYFVISSLIVIGLSVAIGIYTNKKSPGEIAVIMCRVVVTLATIAGLVYGVSRLMAALGIAESSFVF